MSGALTIEPYAAAIAVLDDETEEIDRLEIALATYDNRIFEYATDYLSFRKLIQQHQFDAVSIDWELQHGVIKGPEILQFLIKEHPEIARVVYTKHQRNRDEAMELGADIYLIKQADDNMREYREAMRKAVRLGLARRIVRRLVELGETQLPDLPPGQLLDEENERIIQVRARKFSRDQQLEGQEDEKMEELLTRRGWSRNIEFHASSYARQPWFEKIKQLMSFVEASSADIANILGVDPSTVEKLLNGASGSEMTDRSLLEAADRLLSVLGYVLRLSGYKPDLMPYFWKVKDLFKESFEKPPWNSLGFSEYLIRQGPHGLYESLIWIRSH